MADNQGLLSRMDQTGIPLLLARLVLGGLFTWMGIAKIIEDPTQFLKLMRQYEALPDSLPYFLNLVAVVLPWIEMLCGLALLLGVAVRGAALVSTAMLALFTPMILLRGLEIYSAGGVSLCDVNFDCGCGAGVVFLCHKLAENTGLLLLAVLVMFSRSRRFCLIARRPPFVASLAMMKNEPVPD